MAVALAHRGPDDVGVAVHDNVGLVHRRLAIIDPTPAGRQPMQDAAGRWLLTYNGEIFNHLELRGELAGIAWRGGSDTETLVQALAAWDVDAIRRCNGLYAYAALDRARRRLLLVRDRFGVKPLYVARHEGALWFASEQTALLAAGLTARARPQLMEHALDRTWINGELTLLEGVRRVLPGTLLSVAVDTGVIEEQTWYDPVEHVDVARRAALAHTDREMATTEVEGALRSAVQRRLMADVPVGTMCSGGIDSSLVTSFAREAHGSIHAFNAAVIDQPQVDESPHAERVAEHLDVELHTVAMDAESFCADLVGVVRHMEYPLNHESSVPMSQIAALARSRGVKVLLSGEGADELFGGYSYLHRHEWQAVASPSSPLRPARAVYRRMRGRAGTQVGLGPVGEINEFERRLVHRGLVAYDHHRGPRRRLEAGLVADLGWYLPHLLNRQDKSTMKASVETRVPFLDPEVVGLALNLPLHHRVLPERKGVLRDLADRHLPHAVARRPKVGFGFDACGYVNPRARPEALLDGRLRQLLGVPRAAWAQRAQAPAGQQGLLLWTAEMWCRLFLDGASVAAVEREVWR